MEVINYHCKKNTNNVNEQLYTIKKDIEILTNIKKINPLIALINNNENDKKYLNDLYNNIDEIKKNINTLDKETKIILDETQIIKYLNDKGFFKFPMNIIDIEINKLNLINNNWFYEDYDMKILNDYNIPFFNLDIEANKVKFYLYDDNNSKRKKIYNGVYYEYILNNMSKELLTSKIKIFSMGNYENTKEDKINKFKKIVHYINDKNLRNMKI